MNPPNEPWRAAARPDFAGPALIDTHIWIWYLDGESRRMDPDAVALLRRCSRGEGLLVLDMSVWEIGTKVAKGKLRLAPDASSWLARAERSRGLSFLPLDREILLASTRLPGPIHGDPVDRMLIAAAALAAVPLVTADGLIVRHAEQEGGLSVCDARP